MNPPVSAPRPLGIEVHPVVQKAQDRRPDVRLWPFAGDRVGGLKLLRQSAVLRRYESPVLVQYLEVATQTGPASVEPEVSRPGSIGWLRRKIEQWRLR